MIYTKYILFSLLLVCPSVLSAQGITRRIHQIDEVTVWGKRPMKEIGVQKTKFDSLALKENIALSMADILTFNSSVFVKSYGRATLSTVAFRGMLSFLMPAKLTAARCPAYTADTSRPCTCKLRTRH